LHEPFTRLFIAYTLEAINALRHLRELDRRAVTQDSFRNMATVIADHIEDAKQVRNLTSEYDIERELKKILNSLSKGEGKFTINVNPANAFPQLANAICQCSPIWRNHYVFFA
jgi:hypothetical protein